MASVLSDVLEDDAHEIILKSPYASVSYDVGTTSAVEYILRKVEENVKNGWIDWLTNSATGETLLLSDLEQFSRNIASALTKRGMGHGDMAIYMTSDVTRIYAIIIGVWRVGGIMYSSDAEDNVDEVVEQIKDTKARWVFCDPEFVQQIKNAVAKVDWPVEILVFGQVEGTTPVDELFFDEGQDCPEKVPYTGFDEIILIISTSATTGTSKGVIHTNKSILAKCMVPPNVPKSSKQTMVLNRCRNMGGLFISLSFACIGSGLIMMPKITKENIFKSIREYKPNVVIGPPWFLQMLPSAPKESKIHLSCVHTIRVAGAVMTEMLYNSLISLPSVTQVINIYAQTECGGVASSEDRWNSHTVKNLENLPKLSVGRLNPNTELKVVDLDTGRTLGPMEPGELVVQGPSLASGYWNRPAETALTFVNGWVKSGDLGYYDKNGYIFVVNRTVDVFKYRDQYVFPSEVESIILEHPAVSHVCVFGIEDSKTGNRIPRALVILKNMHREVRADRIRDFADGKLADHQRLRGGLYIVDSLPINPLGKILKYKAAKLLI